MTAAVDRAAAELGGRARRDAPLGVLTTYRVGGTADLLAEVASEADLSAVAVAVSHTAVPVLVVGKGSNLLVSDAGFRGVAVVLGDAFDTIEIDGTSVRAGGAVSLPVLARRTASAGLTGFEWAVGVPGSVGGAVRMNAGGHGSDMAATLRRVRVIDLLTGQDEGVDAADLELGYRRSSIAAHHVVVWAELDLARGDPQRSSDVVSEIVRWRRENQPGGQNAGSVFTNPPGDSAGRLIDEAGCKGRRRGTAEVSAKHANFIQAGSGGSADDVFALMIEVRDAVEAHSGVRLHPETVLVGFDTRVFDR